MIEELLNGYGHMNMQMGQTDRAHMFFKMNVHYYPKSANAYDSMAGYYEAQNDIPNALKFAQKAAELSDNEYYKTRIQELKNK